MDDHTVIALVAMVCLTALECIAMLTNADGQYLMPVAVLLAGLGGLTGTLAVVKAVKQV